MALKFKIFDTPVAIDVNFVVIMLVLGSLWQAPELLPAWLAITTGSVLLHELGHAAVFDFYGSRPSIRLYGGGGVTTGLRLPPKRHIAVCAAGPGMGLILGGIVGLTVLASPRLGSNPIVADLLWVNLGWSAINLLPFPGLDGGQLLAELITLVLGRPAELASRVIGLAIVSALFVALMVMGQYSWAFIIGYLTVFSTIRIGAMTGLTGRRAAASPDQLLALGRYEEAFDAARVAMADRPADPAPIVAAADALRSMSRYADSETGYNEVLARDPGNARGLRGRALARHRLGRDAAAGEDLAALLRLTGPQAMIPQAVGLYDADRHQDGYLFVANAIPVVESFAVARALRPLLAMFEFALGREDDALLHTDESLHEMPGRVDLHDLRALILCDMGRFDEARLASGRALSGAPTYPDLLETAGVIERMAGHPDSAVQRLVDSAVARPSEPRARAELATCQIQLGLVGEARAALETLPRHAQRDPFVLYAAAAMAAQRGALDEASRLLRDAAQVRPHLGVRAAVDPLFNGLASVLSGAGNT